MMRPLHLCVVLAAASFAAGCGGAAAHAPPSSAPARLWPEPPPVPPAGSDPFAIGAPLLEEPFPLLEASPHDPASVPRAPKVIGVEPPDAVCDAFVSRRAATAPPCATPAQALAALDAALAGADPAQRDERLASLEACHGAPVGLVRALRAELAPPACADALTSPLLDSPPAGIGGPVHEALAGLAIAGRLERVGRTAPRLAPPHDRARVAAFAKGPMVGWLSEQARAIDDLAGVGSKLGGYARAVVALAAASADFRLVESVRSAPIPAEMAKDGELRDIYYGGLDQALDPRKHRGRDAALVGLREMSAIGALGDRRVERARLLLSTLYGGRRVDALDALLLPELPRPPAETVEQRLAATLPTFYAGLLLDPALATSPDFLRALGRKGVPLRHRRALGAAALTGEARGVYGRARLELARTYWRAVDVDQAVALLGGLWPESSPRPTEATLALATALGLRHGPEDAAAMVRRAPDPSVGKGKLDGLDAITAQGGAEAGMAAYNAALLRQIAAPQGAEPAYWQDVARRYRIAAERLAPGPLRSEAEARATAADATAEMTPP